MNYNFKDLKNDKSIRNDFIIKYKNFILSSASKAVGKHVSENDDEYSVALQAFDEAILKYEDNKGDFFSFAALIIKHRIIDTYRKNKQFSVPFSSLAKTNSDGDVEEFEVTGESDVMSDAALELEALKSELACFGISLFDLPASSPKSEKTKNSVYTVVRFIANDNNAMNSIMKKEIPVKLICEKLNVKPKLLERHRKYIIAAAIILRGEYPIISGYINNLKGVRK